MTGALLIDKPSGPTSHDIVAVVRRTLKVDRAGHTGTLDPLATGLLIVLVGSATRLARFVAADEKEYVADVRLGVATPTYDAASLREAGDSGRGAREVAEEDIESVLRRFRGTFLQTPPPYSAKKIASVPAYEKARKNQVVELVPIEVTVRELERLPASVVASHLAPPPSDFAPGDARPALRLRVTASAGFYVRSLAHDIGQALGCGAHLEALRRTRAGRFRIEDAITLDRLKADAPVKLVAPSALLGHMPAVTVDEDGVRRVAHGNPLRDPGTEPRAPGPVRLLDAGGTLLAVAEPRPGGILQPLVVLR